MPKIKFPLKAAKRSAPRPSPRLLRDRIERFVPLREEYREDREAIDQLLREINEPKDTATYGKSVYAFAMAQILIGKEIVQSADREDREVKELNRQLHKKLEKLVNKMEEIVSDPRLENRLELLAWLSNYPGHFSSPEGGAPPKILHNFLLESIGECLHNAGLTRGRACDLVSEILLYYFGEDIDAAALERQWRSIRTAPEYVIPSARRRQLSLKDVSKERLPAGNNPSSKKH